MKTVRIRKFMPCWGCLIAVLLLWTFGNGRGCRVFDELQSTRLVFPDGLEREGEGYGVMNEGPGLTLPAGRYTLEWEIETDGQNAILVQSTNEADMRPAEIALVPGQTRASAVIESLDEIYNLQCLVDYRDGSYLRVRHMKLTGNASTDRVFLLTFLLLGAAVLFALRASGRLDPQGWGELALLGMAALLASAPNFKESLSAGTDMSFHMDRLQGLVSALLEGQFPARLGARMQNHYGAATSAFYPELFLYLPAGMMLLGATRNFSVQALLTAIHLASALSMRYAASRMFESRRAGTLAAMLYTLSVYRLGDVYQRFALGEALALCFIPLFALGLYEALFGDRDRWRLLALSAAAVYQCHMISTALCAGTALCLCLLFCARIVRQRRFAPLLKAAACALLLNAYAIAPLITWLRQGVQTGMMVRDAKAHLIAPAQLLLPAMQTGQELADASLKGGTIVIGLPLLLGGVAALYAAFLNGAEGKRRLALFLCALAAAFALASTTLCPWARLSALTRGLIDYIQFPWRLLSMTCVCLSLAGGWGLDRLCGKEALAQLGVLALCALTALPVIAEQTRREDVLKADRPVYWNQVFEDYTLTGTVVSQTQDRQPHPAPDVTLEGYEKFGTHIEADVRAPQGGEVSFPLFAFDGYAAELDGERIDIERGENNRIALTLPAGTQGHLRVWFAGKPQWRAAEAVSLLTAALLAVGAGGRRRARAARARNKT